MKRYFAELIGTFFIVLAGTGSLIGVNFMLSAMGLMLPYGLSAFMSAAAFGASASLMYFLFGRISGGHFNPAVTLAVTVADGVKNIKDMFLYIIFQVAGAFLAEGLLAGITGQRLTIGQVGCSELSPLYMNTVSAAAVELILSAVIVFAFLAVCRRKADGEISEGTSASVIGMSVFAVYCFGILVTGGGTNPARTLAADVISGADPLKQTLIFTVIPFVGAVIAYIGCRLLMTEKTVVSDEPSEDETSALNEETVSEQDENDEDDTADEISDRTADAETEEPTEE